MRAELALQRLKDGNQEFQQLMAAGQVLTSEVTMEQMSSAQKPFAAILGCSDSRVPLELIFSQGFGDLFAVRVAGNVVSESQIGSIEFACEQFSTPLVVVLGHTGCGAIAATVDGLMQSASIPSPNLKHIVDLLEPAVSEVLEGEGDRETFIKRATRASVQRSVNTILRKSAVLKALAERGDIIVVGAEYDIVSGKVDFFAPSDD